MYTICLFVTMYTIHTMFILFQHAHFQPIFFLSVEINIFLWEILIQIWYEISKVGNYVICNVINLKWWQSRILSSVQRLKINGIFCLLTLWYFLHNLYDFFKLLTFSWKCLYNSSVFNWVKVTLVTMTVTYIRSLYKLSLSMYLELACVPQ